MVTHQLQVERRTGKVRQSETDVLPLCHATNLLVCYGCLKPICSINVLVVCNYYISLTADIQFFWLQYVRRGDVTVITFSTGSRFDTHLFHCDTVTLGKLFTHVGLCTTSS